MTYDKVAHSVGITGVNEQTNTVVDELRKELSTVVRAVTLSKECLVNVHVAGSKIELGVDTKSLFVLRAVHPVVDPSHLLVAEVAVLATVALSPDVVQVQAGLFKTL